MIGKDKTYYGIGINTSDLQRDADRAKKQFKGIGDTAVSEGQRINTAFKGLIAGMIGAFGVNELRKVVSEVARVRNEFEQLEISFTTMLGSREKGNALMRQAVDTAARTPFDLSGVATGYKQLLAYGIEVDKIDKSLKMLGDVASGLSVPLNDIVYLYGTLNASGRVATIDIRQFAGRGIPIYEELAKVLGIAKEQVNEFASAGKISFADVEKAFQNMTSAGGRFNNLMEAQSKSIGGMQANLEDAIDMMKNDLGKKLEPFIKGAITSAGNLVENYEEIGRTIGGLVVAYGSYKAVMITLTAIEANRRKVLVLINQMAKVQMALNKSITKAEAVRIVQTELLTKALIKQRIEQLKLNLAVMANPYVIASVAVAGLALGIYKLITAETAAEKATKAFNDSLNKQKEQTDNLRSETEKLIGTIKDETATQNQKHSALTTLQALYPSIFKNLDIEIIKNRDLADMIRQVNLELENKNRLQNAGDLDRAKKIYANYKDYGVINSDDLDFVRKLTGNDSFWKSATKGRYQLSKELGEWIKTAEKAQTDEFKNRWVANDPKSYYTALADSAEKEKKRLEKLDADFRKTQIGDVKWSPYDSAIQAQNKIIQDSKAELGKLTKETKEETSTARDEIAKWNKELATLKTEREKILNSVLSETDRDKKLAEIEEREKTLRDKLKSRGVDISKGGASGKSAEELKAESKERERQLADLLQSQRNQAVRNQLDLQEAEISTMQDGFDKKEKLIKIQYAKELQAIEEHKQTLLKANEEKAKAEWETNVKRDKDGKPISAFSFSPTLSDEQKKNLAGMQSNARANLANENKKILDEVLSEYKNFEQQRADLVKKFANDRVILEKAGTEQSKKALEELTRQEQKALMDFDLMVSGKTTIMQRLFGDLTNYTIDELKELQKQAEEVFMFLMSGQYTTIQGKLFGISEKDFEEFIKPENLERFRKALQGIKEDINQFQSPLDSLKDGFKKLFDAENKNNPQKTVEAVNQITQAYNQYADAVGLVADVIGNLADLTGSEVLGNIASGLNEALAIGNDVMSGASTGAAFGPAGAIAGAAVGLIKGVTGLLAKNKKHREELKKAIKENEEKEHFGQLEVERLWRQKYEWAKKIGETTLNHIKREGEELKKQTEANAKEQSDLWEKLTKEQYKTGERFEKTGLFGWGKGKTVTEWASLAGKTWEEIEKLASQGKLSEEGMKFYEELKKAKEEGADLTKMQLEYLEKNKEIFTGTSYDNLVSGIVNAFKQGKRSATDFANSFEDLMRGAIESSLNLLADESMREWYDMYYEFAKDGLTSDEIEQLKKDYILLNENLNRQALDMEKITGIRLSGQNQGSATYGAYEKITQDQADSIDGRLTGIHMEVVSSSSYLSNIDVNIMQMNTVMIDSWQELTDINKNTKQLYEMNERLGKIEKNTKNI